MEMLMVQVASLALPDNPETVPFPEDVLWTMSELTKSPASAKDKGSRL